VDGCHVDDRAAALLLHHPPRRRLGGQERGGQIDVDDSLPLSERHLEKRLAGPVAGVVDQHVDGSQLLTQLVEHLRAFVHRV